MSKLLVGPLVAENKMQVSVIYNLEVEENQGIDRSKGVEVDEESSSPAPKPGIGYNWFVNPETKEQWFEEVEVPLTSDDKLTKLEQENAELKSTNEVLLNRVSDVETTIADILFS